MSQRYEKHKSLEHILRYFTKKTSKYFCIKLKMSIFAFRYNEIIELNINKEQKQNDESRYHQ